MDSASDSISMLTLDRLVDGVLPQEEVAELLRGCEQTPLRWKQIAMAFLQDQALRVDLLSLRPVATSANHLPIATDAAMIAKSTSIDQPSLSTPVASSRLSARRSAQWLAIAMLAFAAFYLGTFWRIKDPIAAPVIPEVPTPKQSIAKTAPKIAPTLPITPSAPPTNNAAPQMAGNLLLQLEGKNDEKPKQLVLPVVYTNATQGEQLAELSTALPEDLEARLRQTGYSIIKHRDMIPVSLTNGSSAMVPVARYQIVQPILQ